MQKGDEITGLDGTWFGISTIIIGAANRKIFQKDKCGEQLAAPRLFG